MSTIDIIILIFSIILVVSLISIISFQKIKNKGSGECACCSKKRNIAKLYRKKYKKV